MYFLISIIVDSRPIVFIQPCFLRATVFYFSLFEWTRYRLGIVRSLCTRVRTTQTRAHTHIGYNTGWMPNAEDWWRRQGRREWSNDPKSRPCWLMGIISKSGDNYFWKIKNSTIVINYSKCNASGRNRITLKTNNNSSHDRSDIGCTHSAWIMLYNMYVHHVIIISVGTYSYLIIILWLILSKVLLCIVLLFYPRCSDIWCFNDELR